jgi:hypothetical protein
VYWFKKDVLMTNDTKKILMSDVKSVCIMGLRHAALLRDYTEDRTPTPMRCPLEAMRWPTSAGEGVGTEAMPIELIYNQTA